MADIYLCSNSHESTDIDLRTAAPCAAETSTTGNLRRHQGNSPGRSPRPGAGTFAYRFSISGVGVVDTIRNLTAAQHSTSELSGGHHTEPPTLATFGILCGTRRITAIPSRSYTGVVPDDIEELFILDLIDTDDLLLLGAHP